MFILFVASTKVGTDYKKTYATDMPSELYIPWNKAGCLYDLYCFSDCLHDFDESFWKYGQLLFQNTVLNSLETVPNWSCSRNKNDQTWTILLVNSLPVQLFKILVERLWDFSKTFPDVLLPAQ